MRHAGYVTWKQGRSEIEPWINRVNLPAIGIMGGEPLMNPDLESWLTGIRKLLPHSQIRFVTNGLLLSKNWHIFELLRDIGNSVFKISAHVDTPELDSVINRIMNTCDWEPVTEYGIERWKDADRDFRFQIARPTRFIKTFQNDYSDMAPHNNLPADSFKICVQQRCPLLWKGRLFKCGTLALTPDMIEQQGSPNQDQWKDMIDTGLGPDCTDNDLEKFINNFGHPHRLCAQCPSINDVSSLVDHRSTVFFK
jgi:sulfatase maturation enzyme AslB (radical SAM superfamily)